MPSRLAEMLGMPDITGVSADSRLIGPGMLYAALPGSQVDGRDFIAQAVARGAAAVLAPEGTTWPGGVPNVPLILDAQPRRLLARLAAAQAGPAPDTVVAVTGTNGKTSTAEFLRQIYAASGRPAASLGTLGVIAPGLTGSPGLTTPDPVALAETLANLARGGVKAAVLEASSHGLDQFRLDGLHLAAAGFSNLTRDHLDYHGTLEAYGTAKLRLFAEVLPHGAPAVASTQLDAATQAALRSIPGLHLHMVGESGGLIRLERAEPRPGGQTVYVAGHGPIALALPGRFQADNALLAAGLAMVTGVDAALDLLPRLTGVRGRMELAGETRGAAVYVDFAHTPDALERLLLALRPHTAGRLHVVFGAGGDRDRGKRPLMGAVAARLADRAIVTDDNPRSEDPAAIRAAILAACPGASEIGDRAAAIAAAIEALRPGDVLAVAGKGHEQGQTAGGATLPFDDVSVVQGLPVTALWTAEALVSATGGAMPVPFEATGVSIDTRTLRPGDLFVALVGERDGHAHAEAALAAGAAGVMVHRADAVPAGAPVLVVEDTLAGLHTLGRAGRARFGGRLVAVTGSVGKTTTKEMLRAALSACGPTHAAEASYNNHWGVPLTLARLPAGARFCVVEIGMNQPGEVAPLAALAAPHVAVITTIAAAHIGHLGSLEAIADEKAAILTGLAAGGVAVLPADSAYLPRLQAAVPDGVAVRSFGRAEGAEVRLLSVEGGRIHVAADGQELTIGLAAPGAHMAQNAAAALAACQALGADLAQAAVGLGQFAPGAGRGLQRELGDILLLDESYNASTASVRAALEVLRTMPGERRVAVLGDMLELGEFGPAEHASLAPDVARSVDVLYACGPLMRHLFEAVPPAIRGVRTDDSGSLAPVVAAAVRPGDAVLVKGSLGSRMKVIVTGLEAHLAGGPG